jgi:hypothetical protein
MAWFDEVQKWLSKPENQEKIITTGVGSVIVALVLALIFWLTRVSKGLAHRAGGVLLFFLRSARDPLAARLEKDRRRLENETFRVQHAWMKEGQTLNDILVPVVIQSNRLGDGIEDWTVVLADVFQPGQGAELTTGRRGKEEARPAKPLVVIGNPGSGKTVALKVAAPGVEVTCRRRRLLLGADSAHFQGLSRGSIQSP